MNVNFKNMQEKDIPLWKTWSEVPHVKEVWFIEGYETTNYIYQKIKGNGYDHSFIIYVNNKPIGYIQCCDLYAYRTLCPKPKGLFTQEERGTFCVDLFIAESDYLNKGYGTEIVRLFTQKVIQNFGAKKILIDPASNNQRAIRCYEKAGFETLKNASDGITECTIMQFIASEASQ